MFIARLLRVIGWIGIVVVALPGLVALVLSANVAVKAGTLLALGEGALVGALLFLLGSMLGAASIALASVTEDVRIMRDAVTARAVPVAPSRRPAPSEPNRT